MKPIDFSLTTFAELKSRLDGLRADVHRAWLAHGPGTTRDVAAKAQIDILTFRPRSTELYQLGLLELTAGADGAQPIGSRPHEGIYRARTIAEWEQWFQGRKNPQTQLQLT